MRSFLLSLLLVFTAVLLFPLNAHATSVATLTDSQLVQFSDTIAHVTILSAEPFRFDENTILTRVTAQVRECLKSCDDTETIVFYTRGGRLDDTTQVFPGEFKAAEGSEVVVFLEKIGRYEDRLMVLGLEQGAFRIVPVPMSRMDMKYPRTAVRHFRVPGSSFDASPDLRSLKDAIRLEMEHSR
ncbi:MAG: hypothetical protein IJ268_13250 [Proteobacteria bacterium]|nr:hypothetical protein [Pseudomonadota bacterium]